MINFKKHREFRKKLKSAIKKGTLGLIDIGSSKIVCIIIKFSKIENNSKNLGEWDKIKEYGKKINDKTRNKKH